MKQELNMEQVLELNFGICNCSIIFLKTHNLQTLEINPANEPKTQRSQRTQIDLHIGTKRNCISAAFPFCRVCFCLKQKYLF